MKNIIIFILSILLVIFVLDYKKNNDSAGFLPGDVFYFLDSSWEWAQENLLTYSEDKKLELKIKFLEERLEEIKELERKKDLTKERVDEFIEKYNILVEDVNEGLKKAKETSDNVDNVIEEIKSISEKNKNIIKSISDKSPEFKDDLLKRISNFNILAD